MIKHNNTRIDSVQIGKQLRTKRLNLGLTLADIAALTGIGINTISRIENGNPNATIGALLKLSVQLGLECRVENISAQDDADDWV